MRNVAAGSFAKRLVVPEGTELAEPTIEICGTNKIKCTLLYG